MPSLIHTRGTRNSRSVVDACARWGSQVHLHYGCTKSICTKGSLTRMKQLEDGRTDEKIQMTGGESTALFACRVRGPSVTKAKRNGPTHGEDYSMMAYTSASGGKTQQGGQSLYSWRAAGETGVSSRGMIRIGGTEKPRCLALP